MHRWHLSFLLFRPGDPNPTTFTLPSCRFHYLSLSNPGQPHQKHYPVAGFYLYFSRCSRYLPPRMPRMIVLLVELAGIEPASRNPLLQRNYNHTKAHKSGFEPCSSLVDLRFPQCCPVRFSMEGASPFWLSNTVC